MAAASIKVERVYDPDCPKVDRARERLRPAIARRGQGLRWTEWRSDDSALPGSAILSALREEDP
jgi:hypothetical protein